MASPGYPIVLTETKQIAPNTLELTYQREDGGNIAYLPGQFFSIHFPFKGQEKSRSYSAIGRIEDLRNNKTFSFAIAAVPDGVASHYFFAARPGDKASMSGPFGALTLTATDPARYLLIATGTGIAPYRTMLPTLEQRLRQNPALQVTLVMGVRSPQELIYGEEFTALAAGIPGFNFYAYYSRQMPGIAKSFEQSGRVTEQFEKLQANPDHDLVYLCGNPEMVEQSVEYFTARGFTAKTLKREKYSFSTF